MKQLQVLLNIGNNKDLTKNSNTQCQALNMAFFVPEILAFGTSDFIQNAVEQMSKMGTCLFLSHMDKIRFLRKLRKSLCIAVSRYGRVNGRIQDLFVGNKSSRVRAISDTRPPVIKAGGSTKTLTEGFLMPNTSNRATIRTIAAIHTQKGIIATIHTRYQQKAVIGRLFGSYTQLEDWLSSQGLNSEIMGGAK